MPDLPEDQAHALMWLLMDSRAEVPTTIKSKLKIEKYVVRRNGLTVTDGGIEALVSWLLHRAVAFRTPKGASKRRRQPSV